MMTFVFTAQIKTKNNNYIMALKYYEELIVIFATPKGEFIRMATLEEWLEASIKWEAPIEYGEFKIKMEYKLSAHSPNGVWIEPHKEYYLVTRKNESTYIVGGWDHSKKTLEKRGYRCIESVEKIG